jgi:hypothetical protein
MGSTQIRPRWLQSAAGFGRDALESAPTETPVASPVAETQTHSTTLRPLRVIWGVLVTSVLVVVGGVVL